MINKSINLTRRNVIQSALACAALSAVPSFARAALQAPSRSVNLYNTHTGENLKTVYWEEGVYLSESLKDIAYVLRDHRNNEMYPVDPRLLDVLMVVHQQVGSRQPYDVISGYRSPQTNAMLHAESSAVAVHSKHMYGKAIDIRLTDRPLSAVHNVALALQQGGVGYYPYNNFVHMDTGPVRKW